jgi:hypothetical protein
MFITALALLASGMIIMDAYYELQIKELKEAIVVTSSFVIIVCILNLAWIPAIVWFCIAGLEYKEYLEM